MLGMPELPEVEVLRRSLEPYLLGERIERVAVHSPALREPIPAARLRRRLTGQRVERLRRRAKYLLVDLEGGETLVVHLGMTGTFTLDGKATGSQVAASPIDRHEHVTILLRSGRRLRFRDPRRFGLFFSMPTAKIAANRHFAHLGIEPLEGELTGPFLRQRAAGRRGPVKPFLMDARVVVGVGNIYASEALHQAALHPNRSVARIAAPRWQRLAEEVRAVLAAAIEVGGTTLNDFADGEGKSGYFQIELQVYGREGEPCPRCGGAIRRILQAGRSTFYCPKCQR